MKSHVLDAIRRRRSVRSYAGTPVEQEKLDLVLEAARLAPSACNRQPWHFIVVRDPSLISELARCVPAGTDINRWMEGAPVVIVACAAPHLIVHKAARLFGRDNHLLDMGIALEHMVLTAAELDIGTCWIGWFSEKKVKKLLAVPPSTKVTALLVMGYADTPSAPDALGAIPPRPRRNTAEIVSFDRYGVCSSPGGVAPSGRE